MAQADRFLWRLSMFLRRALYLLAAASLSLTFISAQGETPAKPPIDLGGSDRYATYVSTDKPIYRPGETLYVRAAVLKADSHTPLGEKQASQSMIEIKGPKGDVVASGLVLTQDSVAGFSWPIPASTAGGEYTIKVSHPLLGYAPGERKFDIRAYRAPRLKSQTVFLRDGYGPGDMAGASLHVDQIGRASCRERV